MLRIKQQIEIERRFRERVVSCFLARFSHSETMAELKKIDFSNCPQKVKSAAWSYAEGYIRAMENSGVFVFVYMLPSGMYAKNNKDAKLLGLPHYDVSPEFEADYKTLAEFGRMVYSENMEKIWY